jgi:DNA-binding beta-propeller fold protein YncE
MGTGRTAFLGEGAPPDQVALYYPIDMAFDRAGRFLVLDYNNQRIRRLDPDGLVRTIMGTGFEDTIDDGTPPLQSSLHHAFSMCYDAAGNLYLAGNHVPQLIELVAAEDLVYVIAGVDLPGYSGDSGPALEAELDSPCGIAVAPGGFPIYFADTYNHCIRTIDASGTIRTLAGNGERGLAGDGGPSEAARLSRPYRVRLDHATGDLYIADTENHLVRKIDPQGIITRVAGTGESGFGGDGGAATAALLDTPLDARVGPDGAVYIADARNNRIRRVSPDGIITTVAGTGTEGYSGDGGPARSAELSYPAAVIFDDQGDLWIADSYNSVIRRITGPLP